MVEKNFEFKGGGIGFFWLMLWTVVLTVITFSLFFPWAYSAQQRWIADNTYVGGKKLVFKGSGLGFFGQYIIIIVLSFITFGLYGPWAYCRIKRWQVENLDYAA